MRGVGIHCGGSGVSSRTASWWSGFLVVLLSVSGILRAGSSFYVDSDWEGTQGGTAGEPWKYLSPSAWSAINGALASGDVTIYFSAREASSESEDVYDTNGDGRQDAIDLTLRTDAGTSVLTLDGNSRYNTNDAAPGWVSYSGNLRNRVRSISSQNPAHAKIGNIVVRGFHMITTDGNKSIAICGDNWVVENCECEHGVTANDGPCLLLVPTADLAHEGSSDYAPICTNIVIRNNRVHDTFGEALYIGGGGVMDGTPGAGYPSHDQVLIESNIVYNAGTRGGEGDGMDIKGGIRNLTIRANEIYAINGAGTVRAIVVQGQMPRASQSTVIEGNRIHDSASGSDGAIVVGSTWGTAQGVTIRNNVIFNVNVSGIWIYNSQDTVGVYNNTISGCSSFGILSHARVSVLNNLVFTNNGGGAQVSFVGGAAECDHNAYSGEWGYAPAGESSLSLGTNEVANVVVGAAVGDFTLKPGSPVIGRAKVLTGFSHDTAGRTRGAFWDIGAYQHTSVVGSPPTPPANLRVVTGP